MNYLPSTLLSALVVMTTGSIAWADTEQVPTTELIQGATLLQTQPASVNQASGSSQLTPYKAMDLNNAAASLQANPRKSEQKSILPPGLVQQTPPAPINPIDFFKVPALDSGVKLTIGRD